MLTGAGAFFQVEHFNSVQGEILGIRIARADGVDGGGVLLKVDFRAKAAGVSTLEVRGLKLGTSVRSFSVTIGAPFIFGAGKTEA